MKVSSTAVFFTVAIRAFSVGASAVAGIADEKEALQAQAIIPEAETLLEFINCDTKTDCPRYGVNTCTRIDEECNGQCFFDGTSCRFGGSSRNSGRGSRSCRDINSRNACRDNNDCEYVNNRCRDRPRSSSRSGSLRCSDFDRTSRNPCEREGCSWNSNTQDCSLRCSDLNDTSRSTCERSGFCSWSGGSSRRCELRACSALDDTTRGECEDAGSCSWDNSDRTCRAGSGRSNRNCRDINSRNTCRNNDNCEYVNNRCRVRSGSLRCSDFDRTSRNTCQREGCSWNPNSQDCSLRCSDLNDTSRSTCERSGFCTWSGSSSRRCDLRTCSALDGTTRGECEDNGSCFWNSNDRTCSGSGRSNRNCRDINSRNTCLNNNCDFVGGQCRVRSGSLRCSDFDLTSRNTCEREGCVWDSNSRNCRLDCRGLDNTGRSTCERSGFCVFTSGSRNCDLKKSCNVYDDTNRSECENANPNCTWRNNNRTCRLLTEEVDEDGEKEEA